MSLMENLVPSKDGGAREIGLSYRFGIIPLPLFAVLAAAVVTLTLSSAISQEMPVMIAVLATGGFACAWIGGLVPWIKRLGGPALVAAFLPSYLVSRHWLPANLVEKITSFTVGSNFIYLFITAIIVGSILGMNRAQLVSGMLKIFVPLMAGSAVALVLGAAGGLAVGLKLSDALLTVVVPVMAGGVGEGVIPLSVGYAEIVHGNAGFFLARLLPVVLFANFVAIVLAGVLSALGSRFPGLTGNGNLQPGQERTLPNTSPLAETSMHEVKSHSGQLEIESIFTATLLGIALYLIGVLCHRYFALPAPVVMLALAVLLKLCNLVPSPIEVAASQVGHFFAVAVTYPLLFAVAVALTPWSAIMEALHPANLLVITLVVVSLTGSGFFFGKLMRLFPIEAALVNACHSGSGGTGAVAILTAAERMELMPFAQIATRIGGAITVTLALLALRFMGHL
jgi:Na+/citrate or Na+/malate symporter